MSNIDYEENNLPTMEDIRKLAMNEPIIAKVMMLHRHDDLTERDALIMMVIAMTESKNGFQKQALHYAMNSAVPINPPIKRM